MLHEQAELTGTVHQGVIVIDQSIALPEGQTVKIIVNESAEEVPKAKLIKARVTEFAGTASGLSSKPEQKAASPLGDFLLQFAGIGDDLPPDMAENHAHYLYGAPKKEAKREAR